MDAANLLKPMLARGELRCIGATTLEEYKLHIEKDEAFARRMQVCRVESSVRSSSSYHADIHPCLQPVYVEEPDIPTGVRSKTRRVHIRQLTSTHSSPSHSACLRQSLSAVSILRGIKVSLLPSHLCSLNGL